MAVIWGLDLSEIRFGKFASSHMFNKRWYLRRERMAWYQVAMIAGIISDSIGEYGIDQYKKQQRLLQAAIPGTYVYNNDYIGVAAFNAVATIWIAIIYGSAFFFDLFWPERKESKAVRLAWLICGSLAALFVFADGFSYTIIVATRQAYVVGTQAQIDEAHRIASHTPPFVYRQYPRLIAAIVLLWICVIGTLVSTFYLFKAYSYIGKHGAVAPGFREEKKTVDSESSQDATELAEHHKETGDGFTPAPPAEPVRTSAV